MILIIAEKPSVAGEIAKVVGATTRGKGYLSGNDYIVSWCVGHLIELAKPGAYGEGLEKWSLDTLPIIPENYITEVSSATADQYAVLKELMSRADVSELVEATDAGREGELIFRLVYNQAGCKKPFKRLWISSMEESPAAHTIISMKLPYAASGQIGLSGSILPGSSQRCITKRSLVAVCRHRQSTLL